MVGFYILLAILVVSVNGDILPFQPHDDSLAGFTTFPELPDFDISMSQRSYAYITAALIFAMFLAIVYCHVVSVRKTRSLEQYAQQGTLPEWSPLLIDRKNIRPPPPYEQVV